MLLSKFKNTAHSVANVVRKTASAVGRAADAVDNMFNPDEIARELSYMGYGEARSLKIARQNALIEKKNQLTQG